MSRDTLHADHASPSSQPLPCTFKGTLLKKIAELELPVARIIPRNNARARPEETGGSLLALEVDVAVAYELSPAI